MRATESILDIGFGIIAHLAERYKELREKGKELRGKVWEKLQEKKAQGREIREKLEGEISEKKQKLYNLLGLVSKKDIEELKEKLAEIERKLSGQ
ncbi:hypothetical protein H5T87_01490 [bacterium]|nr:hypothetical protein [bacterium]